MRALLSSARVLNAQLAVFRFLGATTCLTVCFFAVSLTACLVKFAHAEDGKSNGRYLGVASCASSNCHGGVSPRKGTNVLQNEYTTWFKYEAHSQAYAALLKPESKIMAKHLGLPAAEKADLCLRCHATYPAAGNRGPKFRISDGVGCESCHGASENWIQSHAARESTHADNVSRGLIDLVALETRTKICLECHHGTDDQTVNHRLIGAGHPRLTFELDTYSVLQPNHWEVDQDYTQRKGSYNAARAWLVGQITRASEMVKALQSKERSKHGALPELSLFYCYTCHHGLSDDQWKTRSYGGRPGELRLNLSSLIITREALRVLDPTLASELEKEISALISDYASDGQASNSLQKISALLTSRAQQIASSEAFSGETVRELMRQLLRFSATTPSPTFEVAEQCAMAISALSAAIDPSGAQFKTRVDKLYEALKDEESFLPEPFTKASENFLQTLPK